MKRLVFFITLIFLQVANADLTIDLHDPAKLQRGAEYFMNYCSGCHSLRYLRYSQLANDPIQTALLATDATEWFGIVPRDLSLITRERDALWVYHYLKGFYPDDHRPFGTNNSLLANTAMPNVLSQIKGDELDELLSDLLTFLVYAGEPVKLIRYQLGVKVLLFLALFCLIAYWLKNIYWKKVSGTKKCHSDPQHDS